MNSIGIVDSYGKRRGHLDKFIEQQIRQQNDLALTKKPLVAGDNKGKPSLGVSNYSCAICNVSSGLKIKCAVVGCNEYFHGSCLTPTNSITFTTTKGGRVVMNTLCKFHFGLAAEETTVLPQNTNASVQANDLAGSKVFNYTNYMSDKNRESNTSQRRASNHTGSSSLRKTTNIILIQIFQNIFALCRVGKAQSTRVLKKNFTRRCTVFIQNYQMGEVLWINHQSLRIKN